MGTFSIMYRLISNLAQICDGTCYPWPGCIVRHWRHGIGPLFQATRSIPVVFANVPDPVGSGFVESLSRPGGNTTGFLQFEYSLSGKWPELLKQIAPSVTRVAVLRDLAIPFAIGQFAVIQAMAPSQRLDRWVQFEFA
jgi:putative ABC transport system substrate-binding protein